MNMVKVKYSSFKDLVTAHFSLETSLLSICCPTMSQMYPGRSKYLNLEYLGHTIINNPDIETQSSHHVDWYLDSQGIRNMVEEFPSYSLRLLPYLGQ